MKSNLIIAALSVLALVSCSKTPAKNDLKIVGYLPAYRTECIAEGAWKQTTHINLSFAHIEADGSVDYASIKNNMASFIPQAQAEGVKVLVSIGGGGGAESQFKFASAIHDPVAREQLFVNLVVMADDLGLDGIDVDYEAWGIPAVATDEELGEDLELLLASLRGQLGDKLLTSALAPYGYYTKAAIDCFDYGTVMAYDLTGPWAKRVGPHSPFEYFVSTINTFLEKGFTKDKLVAGVPFYGYGWAGCDPDKPYTMTYSQIVDLYPGSENQDSIADELWYNGFPEMTRKCQYILDNDLAGIMFWELSQDSKDPELSLLNKIVSILK